MAETFRQNPSIDIATTITDLKTGEALVSMLDEEGRPTVVERAMIVPPHSLIGTLDPLKRRALIENSPFFYKYNEVVDKESAYEMLKSKVEHQAQQIEAEKNAVLLEKEKRSQELEELKLQREIGRAHV